MAQKTHPTVKIALLQGLDYGSASASLEATSGQIRRAAAEGAQIICTQELFNTPYFCVNQNVNNFDLAEPIPGPSTKALSALAQELKVVLIAALFEKRATGIYHNTAVCINADGELLGEYRKMHIPQDPGFEEKFYFSPGDLGYPVWKTAYGTIGVLICWDQWFPEAARMMALAGAEILFYPTAIGWLAEEKVALGSARHHAWETVQCGHAIANGCYLAAVNRVGIEGQTEFWGQSFVADFYGQVMERAPIDEDCILTVECDLRALELMRQTWPFFRDRRIDSYAGLTERALAVKERENDRHVS
ncbi:MAG: acyltransferase [Verrucomicrobia bacterium]|nr:acyltransferase [Verrucomicrobiota bacterium]